MKKQELFNNENKKDSLTNDSPDKRACTMRHTNTMPAVLVCWSTFTEKSHTMLLSRL